MKTLPFLFLLITNYALCQSAIIPIGGNVTGNGSVSYTVGQISTQPTDNEVDWLSPGVQQVYEISISTGLINPSASNLKVDIFPNPVTERLMLKSEHDQSISFTLFDGTGKRIRSDTFQNSTTINMAPLSSGIYFLQITAPHEYPLRYTIVKP